jgi:hypothetical protein
MGFLGFFLSDAIKNENRTKPFYETKSNDERKDWFARTKPWHKVNERIIAAIVEKFGDDPLFEIFVVTSMEQNLVTKYEQLNKPEFREESDLICSLISNIIYDAGSVSASKMINMLQQPQFNSDLLRHHYKIVMGTFEPATVLDKSQIAAYYQLSIIKGLLNKPEEAIKYAKRGLTVLHEIQAKDIPFHLSKIDEIKSAKRHYAEMEKKLSKIIEDLEK